MPGQLIFSERRKTRVGEFWRFHVRVDRKTFRSQNFDGNAIYMRIRNEMPVALRPIYLMGPYSFYVDVRPYNYDEDEEFTDAYPPKFVADLKPGNNFITKLVMDSGSLIDDSIYAWTIDVVCQLAVMTVATLKFEIRMATSRNSLKSKRIEELRGITIVPIDTETFWETPPKFPDRPVHLVVLTHGIFSTIGCDMLYLKDRIEKVANDVDESVNQNVVVRGCITNVGKSGHGIHYLGRRVALMVYEEVEKLRKKYVVDKITFIGHSLGGPTQAMAIHYLTVKHPEFFGTQFGLQPINFIALASPMLGIIGDYPMYITLPLDFGALGLTGRDLNLDHTPLASLKGMAVEEVENVNNGPFRSKIILEIIPQAPAKHIFEQFVNRTVYSNVINDGIVPLRTSSLMYLDWGGLAQASKTQKDTSTKRNKTSEKSKHGVSEVASETPKIKELLQWSLPQALMHRSKVNKFRRGQIVSAEPQSAGSKDVDSIKKEFHKDDDDFDAPSEASAVLSALSILVSDLPDEDYIRYPSIRKDSVVHDRLYTPDELPPSHYADRSPLKKLIYPHETVYKIQENIARAWQETMSWRKVLVKIQADAHNNIIVRRRFINFYGNVAVAHMVKEHFGQEASEKIASHLNQKR